MSEGPGEVEGKRGRKISMQLGVRSVTAIGSNLQVLHADEARKSRRSVCFAECS